MRTRRPAGRAHRRPMDQAAMNLAIRDIRHNAGRFAFTSVGIGLLLMIVMGMGGIYRGLIHEATLLVDRVGADLWIVQGSTRGPFAEVSRLPATLEDRARAVPGVAAARRFAAPQVSAVLVTLQPGADVDALRRTLGTWPDITVYSTREMKDLLLSGMVDKAKRQLGLFRILLIIISTIVIALIIYTLTLDKIRDIALLKLLGARNGVIGGLILQQALLMGACGYALAWWIGRYAFPHFPRWVLIEPADLTIQPSPHRHDRHC